ncbi:MAG: hypothetical protein J5895_00260 [Alphaproteobacteria bacterium]|nr:hypothetical protein [Alphaproteobacteria bacterium]
MQKNNVRNFVCSFIFSILAVGLVQKAVLRAPAAEPESSSNQKNKVKNISLFAEPVVDLESQLSGKLAGSETIDVSALGDLVASEPAPMEVEPSVTENQNGLEAKEKESSLNVDFALATEVELDAEDTAATPIDIPEHLASGVVYAPLETAESSIESENVDVALLSSDDEIPLTESGEVLYQNIEVSQNASASNIAMLEPNVLVAAMEEPDILAPDKTIADADVKKSELADMFDISARNDVSEVDESAWAVSNAGEATQDFAQTAADVSTDSPWVVAKGNKHAKNQAVVEEYAAKDEQNVVSALPQTDDEKNIEQAFSEPLLKKKDDEKNLAYQMIQNILIPIPEDIANDADLTPDLTSSPKGKALVEKKKKASSRLENDDENTGLFKSIRSWFSKDKNKQETDDEGKDEKDKPKVSQAKKTGQKSFKDKIFSAFGGDEDYSTVQTMPIMPAELRLSFAPNRAEISGQTLRWIYAFADNARDNDDVYIEVRIDGTSSYALQQKRLNLLASIFSARGVDYRKINTIFTSREPNSFIIRNIRFNNKEKDAALK